MLIAETERGLQYLLDSFSAFLGERGFEINSSKSSTFSMGGDGKNKRVKIVPTCFFAQCVKLPIIGVSDTWAYLASRSCRGAVVSRALVSALSRRALSWRPPAYLGVKFDTHGNVSCTDVDLANLLGNLGKAPLKLQQKRHILILYVIPRLIYQLVVCARSRVFFYED
ncbi:unnamed protein product [Ixodes hexagonus]